MAAPAVHSGARGQLDGFQIQTSRPLPSRGDYLEDRLEFALRFLDEQDRPDSKLCRPLIRGTGRK